MSTTSYREMQVKESEPTIKIEGEQKLLSGPTKQSSIAEFLRSGQAAFGIVDTTLVENRNEASNEVQKWMLEQIRERLAATTELYHDDILMLRPLLAQEYAPNMTALQYLYPELSRLIRSNLTYAVAFTNCILEGSSRCIPETLKNNLLRNVADEMATVSIDMRDHDSIQHRLAISEQETPQTDPAEPRPLSKLSPAAFGLFTKHFYGSGRFKPVASMLLRLQSEMNHALIMDLHILFVPFLHQLISLMLVYGIPMSDAAYRGFFESVLDNYLQRFVGQETKDPDSTDHTSWALRAEAALEALRAFDHSYFRDILGERYEIIVLPALIKMQPE